MPFRPATIDDAEMLLAWRNDPLTRQYSINRNEISPSEHLAWLRQVIISPRHKLLIYKPSLGVVRFDIDQTCVLSWTIAPEHRGNGVGYRMVNDAVQCGVPLTARILRENTPSQKIARRCGFLLVEDRELQVWQRPASV